MEIVFLEPSLISLIAIAVMIGTFLVAYLRKIMVTYALILANLFVFFITIFYPNQIIHELGFNSTYLSVQFLPQIYTIFTSMFVHSGIPHILGNMLVLFFMGIAFEQRIGRKKFIIIYLVTGVFAALTQSLVTLGHEILLVGASGAIFGILGAFAYSYPRDEIVMPIPVVIMFLARVKVIIGVLIFAAMETVFVIFLNTQDNTAHFAHLGGLASGVALAAVLIGKKADTTKQRNPAGSLDYMHIQKSDKINFSHLTELAKTPELKKILQRIEHENVLQVRDMWLEHFLEKTTCPVCNKPLNHFNRKIWCEQEHFRTTY